MFHKAVTPSICLLVHVQPKDCLCCREAKKVFSHSQPRCFTAALECFITELNGTVTKECEDPVDFIQPAIDFLKYVVTEIKRSNNDVSIPPHSVTTVRINDKINNKMRSNWLNWLSVPCLGTDTVQQLLLWKLDWDPLQEISGKDGKFTSECKCIQ